MIQLADSIRQALLADPVVWDMAARIRASDLGRLVNADGTPDSRFADASNQLYRRNGGKPPADVNAVARTLLDIRTASADDLIGMWSPPHHQERKVRAYAPEI